MKTQHITLASLLSLVVLAQAEIEENKYKQEAFAEELTSKAHFTDTWTYFPRRSLEEENFTCVTADDCLDSEYYFCNDNSVCEHKAVFPQTTYEIIGVVVFMLIMALSNVAGIGGGGIAIPMAMEFFTLSTKKAIAISSFAILISTLARFFFNINQRHPAKK
jgi:hypothetical protein